MTLQELKYQEYDKFPITNKTRKYLVPSLLSYGNSFRKYLSNFSFVAAGLWDEKNRELFEPYTIGFLVNAKKSSFLNFDNKYIKNHYYFGELLYGKLHMLVIKIPDQHKQAYDMFLESRYSEMYENPVKLFNGLTSSFAKEVKNQCISVCTNDNFYRTELAETLGVPRTSIAKELDSVIKHKEEIFNF
jgi:hypothetical protein